MIERKLHPREFINLGDIEQKGASGTGEVREGCEERYIEISSNWFGPKKRVVKEGNNDKEHRNFIWLPYVHNAINYTSSAGKDVLSGKFTGCYMIAYIFNEERRVGHVATPGAKEAWNELVKSNGFKEILAGFKPSDALVSGRFPAAGRTDSGGMTFGLVTGDNKLYTMFAWKQQTGSYLRIDFVKQMASLNIDQLSNLP